MKSNKYWIFISLITLLSFQKSTPVQQPLPLAQAYGALIDSLEEFKHPTFELALERANFLIDLSSQQKDWGTHFKVLNLKVILAEYFEKIEFIEPFIKILEKRLADIDSKSFPKYTLYKSEIKLRWSELYASLHQPLPIININKEIIEGIKNETLIFEDNLKTLVYAYYDLGYWSAEIGQVTEGIDYFLQSKPYNEARTKQKLNFAIIMYGQLAKRYLSIGMYKESFQYNILAHQAAQELYKTDGITPKNSAFFTSNYHAICKYYLQVNKPDSAFFYAEKASPIAKNYHKIENLLLQAKCFIPLKKGEKAEHALHEALDSIGNKIETFVVQKPQILFQLAQVKYQQQQPVVALDYCQKALKTLDPQYDTNRLENTPSVSRVVIKKELLEVLDFKGKLLQELAQQSKQYRLPAYQTSLCAARIIDSIRNDYTADFDKQYLAQVSYPIYEKALDIAFQCYEKEKKEAYLADILVVMEKSKAVVLLDNLQRGQAEAAFSETDRVKMYQFRKDLSGLDKQVFDLNSKGVALTDTALQRLESERALMNRKYANYKEILKKQYPNYAVNQFGTAPISIVNTRKLLPENGIFITYFVGENSIYSMAIDAKNAQIFRNNNPQKLPQLVESIRKSIRPFSRDDDRTDIKTYCDSAFELYNWLLKDPLSISAKKHAIIVVSPDGALNFIPLDILLTEKITAHFNYKTLPYLLQQAAVSHVSSATLWQAQKEMPHNRASELFVGFAPQYQYKNDLANTNSDKYKDVLAMAEKSGELVDMPNARREVDDISTILTSSKTFIGASATEENFVKNAANYRIVHLSMHAEANDKNPAFSQLIFTQNDTFSSHNRLFMNELQNQKLNADLVVLSACETGFGTLSKGEGVMSLARAFTSIGVPTSVVSLWKIPSGSTGTVLTKFYDYLNQNKSVLTSLRQSKLDYLKTASLNSPYYWAGLIAVGDTEYAPISKGNWYWIGGLIGLFLIGAIYYFVRIRMRRI
jgi:CHAT domain-containing protein